MRSIPILLVQSLALAFGLTGCADVPERAGQMTPKFDSARLDAALAAQPGAARERYAARNPAETLAFFELAPGMTVIEGLPGGGWYSKILIDYLGPQGTLIGADYANSMWAKFGFFDAAYIEKKKTWATDWPQQAEEWRNASSARIGAFVFGELPIRFEGTADAAIFVRAMHNLARFNDDGGYLDDALAETYAALKPGGVVGIVQHEARDGMSDAFASGARGYLKKAFLIEKMREAGFEYVGSRDFNANPKDQPGEEDIVWRLPPTLVDSKEDDARRAAMQAIGESHRMTLKFRKPR